jgi:hypothetical protein
MSWGGVLTGYARPMGVSLLAGRSSMSRVDGRWRGLFLALAVGVAGLVALPDSAVALSQRQATRVALAALKPARESGLVVVFSLSRPIPRGTLVYEATTPTLGYRIRRPVWLYWEDLSYGAMFAHPSVLLLIDAKSGKIVGRQRLEFELAIGPHLAPFLASRAIYSSGRDRVYSSPTAKPPPGPARDPTAEAAGYPGGGNIASRAEALKHDCMIPIGDSANPSFAGNLKAMSDFATKVGLRMPDKVPTSADELAKTVQSMLEHGCNDAFIYLWGDGNPPTASDFPPGAKKELVVGPGTVVPVESPNFQGKEAGVRVVNGALATVKTGKKTKDEFITPDDLINIAKEHTFDMQFKIKVDACFSGRFAKVIDEAKNVRVLEMSSSFNEVSYGLGNLYGIQPVFDPKDPRKKVGSKSIDFYDSPDGATFFTNANVHGLYEWATTAPADDTLVDGILTAFDAGAGQDPARQFNWTHPVGLVRTTSTLPTFKISSTLQFSGTSEVFINGNSSETSGGESVVIPIGGDAADSPASTPIDALEFVVPPKGSAPRQITNEICPASLPSFSITTTHTQNDTLVCQGGSLPVGTAFQMKVHTVPNPSAGMGGQVYARRAGVLEGPFPASGP